VQYISDHKRICYCPCDLSNSSYDDDKRYFISITRKTMAIEVALRDNESGTDTHVITSHTSISDYHTLVRVGPILWIVTDILADRTSRIKIVV
jgi:hypothetical protein